MKVVVNTTPLISLACVGLPVVRTLSLLLRAKQKGYVTQIKPILEEMVGRGRWYSPAVCRAMLLQADEI